ncbi:methyl-accepting chemotaxis protein [Pelotomaculum isophthalicicum JI]|uniref:Methyl-accepting chemotaxis protein n=1 Tax=Pelotomaculum isophthalicicum JI TaxID=947010 RepID=A0A9X4H509_9FIRM|nr:methyl-accepting chemotaxis protein [Pelotomaculum isophthalicicum]MDF9409243.1 methyl-accepting chemotaxis protein [Pelotomaculum isophthalicicum JI]
MFKSIKSKILALLLLAVMVLIATNLIAVVAARRDQAEQLRIALQDSALANSKMVDERIRRHIDRLSVLANTATVKGDDKNAAQAYLLAELNRDLNQEGYYFDLISLADLDGTAFAVDGSRVDASDRAYFQAVLNGQDIVVSEPIISRSGGKISVAIGMAVKRDGRLFRVLIGLMSLERLSDEVAAMRHGENGRAYIIDANGTCIAHPDKELLGVDFSKTGGPVTQQMADMIKTMIIDKAGVAEYGFMGVNSILNYQPIPSTGWILAVVADRNEVFAAVDNLTRQLTAIIVITTLLLLILGWYFTSKTVQPISDLITATSRVAQGDLDTEIVVDTGDEIGYLARSFDQMRQDTKELVNNIAVAGNRVSDIAKALAVKADQTAAAVQNAGIPVSGAGKAGTGPGGGEAGAVSFRTEHDRQGIDNVVNTMREIERSANQVTASLNTLNQAIDDVGQFVEAINAIAGQTNKLALDAAVEATRAGEAGKGFTVVADEVRNLAESSAESAAEISRLISRIVSEVKQQSAAVVVSEDGKKKMPRNERMMQHVNQSLAAIIGLVQDLSEKAKDVAVAAEQVGRAGQDVDDAGNNSRS